MVELEALPAEFATVTRNVCDPWESPEYETGEAQGLAAPSSEQVVLETVPVVVQANDAEVANAETVAEVI